MSALIGVASDEGKPMSRDEARESLIELGLVFGYLEGRGDMTIEQARERTMKGARAIMKMWGDLDRINIFDRMDAVLSQRNERVLERADG